VRDGSWSIAELARMSDVTSRTLRHYDAVGLLPPAWVAADGRRYYRRPELLRLQRILLLRELGMGLKPIAAALEREADPVTVLREHRDRLAGERDRLARLVRTVENTIASLEGGEEMTAEQMFEGFEHNPYEAEARERWGDEAVDASYQRMRSWTPEQAELARTGFTRVHSGLAELLAEGVPVTDPRAQQLVGLHHQVISLFWTPSAEAYRNLGRMYLEDERFRRTIGGEAVTRYLAEAMEVYADARLS
jgi:MerR family transcriptional regulator, thiopeptide resistance regulator